MYRHQNHSSDSKYHLVLLSVSSPIMLGIYSHKDNNLIFSLSLDGKVSNVLPLLFSAIFAKCGDNTRQNYAKHISNFFWCNLEQELQHSLEYKLEKCTISPLYYDQIMQSHNNPLYQSLQTQVINSQQSQKKHDSLIELSCSLYDALLLLSYFNNIGGIYYSRGVGSLSAIKLTHIFLQTFTLSTQIPIYATNSFYFSQNNEIKAFGNLSFFLLDSRSPLDLHDCIILQKSANPSLLTLPNTLLTEDFNDPCIPLYVTPPL